MPRPSRQGQKRQQPCAAPVATAATPCRRKVLKLQKPPVESGELRHKLLSRAATALRPAATPGILPCRSEERGRISAHLSAGIRQGGSTQILYVSGMPGTGKTAVVSEVMEQLQSEKPFQLVHVNAMRLCAPAQIFRELAEKLLPESTRKCDARKDISQFFEKRRKSDPVVVLLIDEVDCLATPNQAVLYTVFDWLGLPHARLVITAISNTMDLPERLLPRVASRFHIERVDFAPYSKTQIHEILCSRLKSHDALEAFNDVVLRLCAARVAGASGDIRKALQVCRRAVESAAQAVDHEGPLGIADIEAAEKELVFANPLAQSIIGLSLQTRRFLAAVVIELQRGDSDVVPFQQAATRFQRLLAIVAVDSERSSQVVVDSDNDFVMTAEIEDAANSLMERLVSMSVLAKRKLPCGGFHICLPPLDIDDLANAVLKAESDPTIRELIEDGRTCVEQF